MAEGTLVGVDLHARSAAAGVLDPASCGSSERVALPPHRDSSDRSPAPPAPPTRTLSAREPAHSTLNDRGRVELSGATPGRFSDAGTPRHVTRGRR
jgi:hypothetical protein